MPNKETKKEEAAAAEAKKADKANDGTNSPVPDKDSKHISSASEAALFKQAENPLGDPHKV
jgi:hypothetical protein